MEVLRKILTRFLGLIIAGGVFASLFTVAGFFGRFWWGFDLLSHFRVQYAVILICSSTILALSRRPKWAVAFVICGMANAALLAPFYSGNKTVPSLHGSRLKLVLTNVHTANTRSDLVRQVIQQENPDLVLLEEVNDWWIVQLGELTNTFSHCVSEPREDNFGIAVFSKLPLERSSVIYLGAEGVPSVFGKVKLQNASITFVGTHPVPPRGKIGTWYRNDQLRSIAAFLKTNSGPIVLLGDLNVTPWSAHFRDLLREAGLKDSSDGFGIQPTWPVYFPPMRIPIDHCLVSSELKVIRKTTGPNVGSDHFPLVIELTVPD